MKFLLLICSDEATEPPPGSEAFMAEVAGHQVVAAEMRAAGVMIAADPLMPTATAQTVRVRGGATVVTAGPFAETVEHIGGYYLIECASMEEAVGWAVRLPTARHGSIEVRPVIEM